jgi:hypothetical protein
MKKFEKLYFLKHKFDKFFIILDYVETLKTQETSFRNIFLFSISNSILLKKSASKTIEKLPKNLPEKMAENVAILDLIFYLFCCCRFQPFSRFFEADFFQ